MPAYKQDIIKYHIERIREVLSLKPQASALSIKNVLEGDPSSPLSLDRVYIGKLLQKIRGERITRYDRVKVEARIAEIQDRTESIIAEMWRILLDQTKGAGVRVYAATTIIRAEHDLLNAQLNAGIFERNLGTLGIKHTYQLAPEQMQPILKTLQLYGIIKLQSDLAKLPDSSTSGSVPR